MARSEQSGMLEIVEEGRAVTVYAWPGCTLQVFEAEKLVEDFSISVPNVPAGMTVKDFTNRIFGGPAPGGRDSTDPGDSPG